MTRDNCDPIGKKIQSIHNKIAARSSPTIAKLRKGQVWEKSLQKWFATYCTLFLP